MHVIVSQLAEFQTTWRVLKISNALHCTVPHTARDAFDV